jgi:2-polyprenyl-3-methyl-5-hydroxy-6-metoxy-1,4-benzoquinol methylase
VDAEYVRRYRDLSERHWWWRAREKVIVELLRRDRPPAGWGPILDIGCGGGVLFDRLAEFGDVRGVEPDPALARAKPELRDRIYEGPFDDRYVPPHPFGLILMLDVLEHLDDPADALRRALGLLRPAGMVLITVPAFRALWTTHDDINQHRTRYTRGTMRELAAAAGLRVTRMRYFFHWTAPVKLAQHAVEALTRPAPTPATVPAAPINAALYALSRIEYRVTHGMALPFGSSLLVMGRRPA